MVNPPPGDDTSDGAIIQRKGRFRVTSADISPKVQADSVFNSLLGGGLTSSVTSAPILTSLQCILQQNTLQREELIKLVKYVDHSSGHMELSETESFNDLSLQVYSNSKERELHSQVIQLQNSVQNLAEELLTQKLKNLQTTRLSIGVLGDMKKICRQLFWEIMTALEKCTLDWNKIVAPKVQGGLGLKRLDLMNTAILVCMTFWKGIFMNTMKFG